MATTQDTRQCRALTADGDRCTRPADEDGFCYQHGPKDETVDEASADGGQRAAEADADEETDEDDADEETTEEEAADESEEGEGTTDEQSSDSDASAGGDGDLSGVMDVRARIESVTDEVVGAPLDRIIEIERRDDDGDGWLVVVEALERSAIPDTEDLLGRYAIRLDADGAVVGYRLRERYRRSREVTDE